MISKCYSLPDVWLTWLFMLLVFFLGAFVGDNPTLRVWTKYNREIRRQRRAVRRRVADYMAMGMVKEHATQRVLYEMETESKQLLQAVSDG